MKILLIIIMTSGTLSVPPAISVTALPSMAACKSAAKHVADAVKEDHAIDTRVTQTWKCVKS